MVDRILDQSAGFDHTSNYAHSLHFTVQQWHQFWHLLVVGSAMAECGESLKVGILKEDTCAYLKSLAEKWFTLAREMLSIGES